MARPAHRRSLAVVDMGSNSFRLEVGRVEGDQIFSLDTWRETLRMGAGLDDAAASRRSAAGGARLPGAIRRTPRRAPPVRRARGRDQRVPRRDQRGAVPAQAERALGFPIDVITGHEEARLIYDGVAHVLPATESRGSSSTSAAARPNSSSAAASSRSASSR